MKRTMLYLFVAVALVWLPIAAMADSISPSAITASGPTGFSIHVQKVVTIDGEVPTFSIDQFADYTTVSLDLSEVPVEVDVASSPGSYVGSFDRSITRIFNFDVTITDLEPGIHIFNIYALVDGGRVATERDSITSTGGQVPEPTTMFLLGSGLLGLWGARKKFKK